MHIQEIEQSSVLQKIYYFVVISFFLTFNDWRNLGILTKESVTDFSAICWPHFKECTSFYIFSNISNGYSLGILYSFLGFFLFGSLFFAFQNKWKEAFILLFLPVLF